MLANNGSKECPACHQTLPATSEYFARSRTFADGFNLHCKGCHNARAKLRWKVIKTKPDLLEKRKSSVRKWWDKLRTEALDAYGGKCDCCGESTPEFLTLDHFNGDGKQHRKLLGGTGPIYIKLRQEGWPRDQIRLLCWNCNCATRYGRVCPHKEMRLVP